MISSLLISEAAGGANEEALGKGKSMIDRFISLSTFQAERHFGRQQKQIEMETSNHGDVYH